MVSLGYGALVWKRPHITPLPPWPRDDRTDWDHPICFAGWCAVQRDRIDESLEHFVQASWRREIQREKAERIRAAYEDIERRVLLRM